jgi:hypothetical protein
VSRRHQHRGDHRPVRVSALLLAVAAILAACSPTSPTPAPSGVVASPSAPAATPDASIVAGMPEWDALTEQWGTFVSEREWGNPRESQGGNGWGLTYLKAIRTPYTFAEDGIAAISNATGEFHVGWAFWDEKATVVTERLLGLSNSQGPHGETILDRRTFGANTPTHSYASYTYEYPRQGGTPIDDPVATPGPTPPWSIVLETAKVDSTSLVMRATVTNTSGADATLHVVLKGWFGTVQPGAVTATSSSLALDGARSSVAVSGAPATTFQASDEKRAIDENLRGGGLSGNAGGTIGALDYRLTVSPGAPQTLTFGIVETTGTDSPPPAATQRAEALRIAAGDVIAARAAEAATLFAGDVTQHGELYAAALGSLLWAKSYYAWDGSGLDDSWKGKVDVHDVLIMPDKWEYPWLASWDTAFHAVAATLIDPDLAATQIRFLLSDRWQQPDGHVPCAEWVMDVECPPLFGWAALRIASAYDAAGRSADADAFLREVYPGLARQYGYWQTSISVGDDLYAGGFLGMDNLPRGRPTPTGPAAQADGSSWMAAFARDLATIADRLGDAAAATGYRADRERVAAAVNARLWDEAKGFYFDADGDAGALVPTVSYTGLVPLIAGIVPADRMDRVLAVLRDPEQLLSPYGVRSVSAQSVIYVPGFAGRNTNSNWRGPVWMPINYLVIEALAEVDAALAADIRDRTVANVERTHQATGRIFEYFDGDTGAGLGADAQTGWTAVVANLIAEGWPAP